MYQHVKVSVLPPLCDESLKQLCFCVCDYFLVCSVVMLPVFIYAACKHIQLCWYRETSLRQPPVGKSVKLVFTEKWPHYRDRLQWVICNYIWCYVVGILGG